MSADANLAIVAALRELQSHLEDASLSNSLDGVHVAPAPIRPGAQSICRYGPLVTERAEMQWMSEFIAAFNARMPRVNTRHWESADDVIRTSMGPLMQNTAAFSDFITMITETTSMMLLVKLNRT